MSWVMRIQNQNSVLDLSDVPTLFLPSLMKKEQSAVFSQTERNCIDVSNIPIELTLLMKECITIVLFCTFLKDTALLSSEDNLSSSVLPPAQSIPSEPVNIPASPIRRSPSRQSSRDSLDEEEEEEECDPDTEIDGKFSSCFSI